MVTRWMKSGRRYFLTGLFVLLPAWGTFLILQALFTTLDGLLSDVLGPALRSDIPGLGLLSLVALILLAGMVATHVAGQGVLNLTEEGFRRIPLVRSIYLTLKGMTDLFKFRERFGRSAVVVFPFPRQGLWALGFIMGAAPPPLQVDPRGPLAMIFVPTAIHPFTGYLAFVPEAQLYRVNLLAEDAMKMEFSAGLYRPQPGWLARSPGARERP
ncbi:DUF502 domain-containing protein [Candidatus Nitrospira bockiana]